MKSQILHATLITLVAFATGCDGLETDLPSPIKINPCDPSWQTAEYHPAPDSGDPLSHFENVLFNSGARWIGRETIFRDDPILGKDHRAIVELGVIVLDNHQLIDSDAWYMADIPMGASEAHTEILSSRHTAPINAQVLGYCFSDHSFCKDPTLPNCKTMATVEYEVVTYDPRCVCNLGESAVNGLVEILP